jgi:hypothetical protein
MAVMAAGSMSRLVSVDEYNRFLLRGLPKTRVDSRDLESVHQ